ncbi:MAG: mercuric reductase, partial [Pirellulales bacterium]|nr:mercuric reductase [Pirellulales bacterium]
RAVMERMRALQVELAAPDSARRFQQLGVEVFFGNGSFTSHNSVDVGGVQLRFKKGVIATGTRPAVPPVPGLESVHYLTNETIFSLTELPKRLAIIGGGPVGCELAQAFVRFGSEVYLIESSSSILPREERDAADLVAKALKRDGVHLLCSAKHLNVSQTSSGIKVTLSSNKKHHEVNVDHLLVAAGRVANVEQLGLEKAGVAYDQQSGVVVNDRLQTTNRKIYAAGDVCSKYKFTHAADAMARIVIGNSLFGKRDRFSRLILPWCTYTSPEVARVGLSQQEADAAKIPIDTYTQPLADIDRAVLDGYSEGFIRVHVRRGSAKILGATIVAERAGELIGEITQAMTHRLSLKDLSSTIHPYPTVGAGISKIGDQYNRTRLTPLVKGLLAKWFAWR